MKKKNKGWQVTCDRDTFEKCLKDKKFAHIVTLARAVNALYSAHALLLRAAKIDTPAGVRERINSYLFSSALLYEALQLIKKMNKAFSHDALFQNGIKRLLKDPTAQAIESLHLKPSRHTVVFHFAPEAFAEAIAKTKLGECIFVSAHGKKSKDLHFAFADVLAVEIHVGLPSDHSGFDAMLSKTGNEMANLVIRFSDEANSLIVHRLKEWGFKRS